MELTRYKKYSREDFHNHYQPNRTYTPGAGKWGIRGIIKVPDTESDFIFFVTLGTTEGEHTFEEGITEDGILSWQSEPRQQIGHPVIQKLINHDQSINKIHLLFRSNTQDDYIYMGDLAYIWHDEEREQPVYFKWQIIGWENKPELFKQIGLELWPIEDQPTERTLVQALPEGELLHTNKRPRPRSGGQRKGSVSGTRDHVAKAKKSKKIGDAGEKLVMKYEQKKLQKLGISKQPILESNRNDGSGYDILSYDENEDEIFIEVKTTMGGLNTPFFVSANEVRVSLEKDKAYYLYRLFDYNPTRNAARFYIIQGALEANFELEVKDYIAYYNGEG